MDATKGIIGKNNKIMPKDKRYKRNRLTRKIIHLGNGNAYGGQPSDQDDMELTINETKFLGGSLNTIEDSITSVNSEISEAKDRLTELQEEIPTHAYLKGAWEAFTGSPVWGAVEPPQLDSYLADNPTELYTGDGAGSDLKKSLDEGNKLTDYSSSLSSYLKFAHELAIAERIERVIGLVKADTWTSETAPAVVEAYLLSQWATHVEREFEMLTAEQRTSLIEGTATNKTIGATILEHYTTAKADYDKEAVEAGAGEGLYQIAINDSEGNNAFVEQAGAEDKKAWLDTQDSRKKELEKATLDNTDAAAIFSERGKQPYDDAVLETEKIEWEGDLIEMNTERDAYEGSKDLVAQRKKAKELIDKVWAETLSSEEREQLQFSCRFPNALEARVASIHHNSLKRLEGDLLKAIEAGLFYIRVGSLSASEAYLLHSRGYRVVQTKDERKIGNSDSDKAHNYVITWSDRDLEESLEPTNTKLFSDELNEIVKAAGSSK